MIKIDIVTLFSEMFVGPFSESMMKRAQTKNLVSIRIHNLRDWAHDKHKTVDDKPFGGGPGMLLKPEPIFKCIEDLKSRLIGKKTKVIFLTPQGKTFSQEKASELSHEKHLIFLCGHYEGVDQRVRDSLIDEEISIGNYVLTGGELPAMVIIDTLVRLIPGVVEGEGGIENDSFSFEDPQFLEYPQYTRPASFQGMKVPEVLVSGNHGEIEKWKEKMKKRK